MKGYVVRLVAAKRSFAVTIADRRAAATLVCTQLGLRRDTLMRIRPATQLDLLGMPPSVCRELAA